MKKIVSLFLASLLACTLRAAAPTPTPLPSFPEVKLTTGEVLKDVKLLSQTPTHVTFKTANGMRQVDKRKLPPELQKQFPYDEEAAERRKEALAEAEAKRNAEREAKKVAGPTTTTRAAPVDKYVRNGVRISFSSDPEGSGPIVTLVNDSNADQEFAKTDIVARMMDDRLAPLRVASRGDKIENGGRIVIVGDVLKVRAHDRLEFRGYFIANYRAVKHEIADVFWAPGRP